MKGRLARPRGAGWFILAVTLLVDWVAAGSARGGTTLMVTDLGDGGAPGQLRTLIDDAAPGATIVIPRGTIELRGDPLDGEGGALNLEKNVTLVGAGIDVTVLEGPGGDRVFNISGDALVNISGMTITRGFAPDDYGGGIHNNGSLTLSNASLTRNGRGGGLANFGGATLTDVTIDGNSAAGSGGGIYNTGTLMLIRATISGNSAGSSGFQSGGGIFSVGSLTLTNVTISGNRAVLFGGGIAQLGSFLTLTQVTIADNTRPASSGGIYGAAATIRVENTIIANRMHATNCGGAGIFSRGHNLSTDGSCGFTSPGDRMADPLLGPLQNDGGATATHALLPSSPAIDAGDDTNCADTDQRGAPRPADGNADGIRACDIGAYEVSPACSGDCGGDGAVTIDDLVLMVNITLGGADAALCRKGDVNGDAQIAVAEIVGAVNESLTGCSTSPSVRRLAEVTASLRGRR